MLAFTSPKHIPWSKCGFPPEIRAHQDHSRCFVILLQIKMPQDIKATEWLQDLKAKKTKDSLGNHHLSWKIMLDFCSVMCNNKWVITQENMSDMQNHIVFKNLYVIVTKIIWGYWQLSKLAALRWKELSLHLLCGVDVAVFYVFYFILFYFLRIQVSLKITKGAVQHLIA